jgi:uncharacterized damage-inducible protein DinB
MDLNVQTAKHLREVYFGGNWPCSSYKEHLADVSWEQAIAKKHTFNTIATLVNHTGYYVQGLIRVLRGEALNTKDALSFDHPPISSQEDWDKMLDRFWSDAEQAATLIGEMPEQQFGEIFTDPLYGIYYRNIHGMIEHLYYHLGQIVLIKKML